MVSIRSAIGCAGHQDEKHVLLACRFPHVCTLRDAYSDLFGGFASLLTNAGASHAESSRAVPNYVVYKSMNQCNNSVHPFISDIVDLFTVPSSQPV